jgi:hypothetical protein
LEPFLIIAIILADIFYFLGGFRIDGVVIATSLGVLWIMIRLITIQSIVKAIEEKVEAKENKKEK